MQQPIWRATSNLSNVRLCKNHRIFVSSRNAFTKISTHGFGCLQGLKFANGNVSNLQLFQRILECLPQNLLRNRILPTLVPSQPRCHCLSSPPDISAPQLMGQRHVHRSYYTIYDGLFRRHKKHLDQCMLLKDAKSSECHWHC